MNLILIVASVVLSLAFTCAFIRLVIGPSLADRVVAADLIGTVASGGITLYSIVTHDSAVLDAVLVLSLTFFMGTIAFAYYLERQGTRS